MILKTNQLMPVEVTRNDEGYWSHPAFDKYWAENYGDAEYLNKSEWDELERHFNIDTFTTSLELEYYDLYQQYYETGELLAWNPDKPVASGDWFLISIYSNEDGAFATWAKPRPNPMVEVEESLKEVT